MSGGLVVEDLSVFYGPVRANDHISVRVDGGKIVGLIGPNGAGKTTFVDALSGLIPISGGSVRLGSDVLSGLAPYRRARLGLARSFQSTQLFDDLTVAENLQVALRPSGRRGLPRRLVSRRSGEPDNVLATMELFGLGDSAERLPSQLSHGQRRLVDVARALVASPRIVLLDEPAAGLDGAESRRLGDHIRTIAARGVGVLLIEHDMNLVLDVCDHICVLDFGRVIASDRPEQIRTNPRVIEAYLGARGAGMFLNVPESSDE
jgi:branched-chain amino acid transport system ATP-binding protein